MCRTLHLIPLDKMRAEALDCATGLALVRLTLARKRNDRKINFGSISGG